MTGVAVLSSCQGTVILQAAASILAGHFCLTQPDTTSIHAPSVHALRLTHYVSSQAFLPAPSHSLVDCWLRAATIQKNTFYPILWNTHFPSLSSFLDLSAPSSPTQDGDHSK